MLFPSRRAGRSNRVSGSTVEAFLKLRSQNVQEFCHPVGTGVSIRTSAESAPQLHVQPVTEAAQNRSDKRREQVA